MMPILSNLFGPKRHPGELDLSVLGPPPKDAEELARFWINDTRMFVGLTQRKEWSPEFMGHLLVEAACTAAAAFAAGGKISQSSALEAIFKGLDEERSRLKEVE